MTSEFEYEDYDEGEWPVAPESEDVDGDSEYDGWISGSGWAESADRTEALISQGRSSAPKGRLKSRAAARRAASARLSTARLAAGLLTETPPAEGPLAGPPTGSGPGSRGSRPAPGGRRPAHGGSALGGDSLRASRPSSGTRPMPASRLSKAGKPGGRLSRRNLVIVGAAALVLGIALAILLPGPGAAWPASVATVKQEIQVACQNPNIASDPGQVNFACNKDTSQVLWVFALLTSGDNAGYESPSGRQGLEPISPVQGGEVAWSLNLHHPYNPGSATDSLAVAARAINNIIGGATVTSQNGAQQVEPGLESSPANCLRYTGSPALITRQGFPAVCANPVTIPEGQAALVSDVYQRWMAGAPASGATNAALFFTNANNPGDPRVQAVLHGMGASGQ